MYIPPELWAVEFRQRLIDLASAAMRSRRHRHLDSEDVGADLHLQVVGEWESGLHPTLASALDPAHHLGLLNAMLQRLARKGRRMRSCDDLAWVEAAPGAALRGGPTDADVRDARRVALRAFLRVLQPPPTPEQLTVLDLRRAHRTWRTIVETTGWKKRKARDAYTRLVKRIERLRLGLETAFQRNLGLREPLPEPPGARRGWLRHRSRSDAPTPPRTSPRDSTPSPHAPP